MSDIKRIIHIADVHMKNFQRLEEYSEQLTKVELMILEFKSGSK